MSKTEILNETLQYLQKLSERTKEVYHFTKFLFEQYENVPETKSIDYLNILKEFKM